MVKMLNKLKTEKLPKCVSQDGATQNDVVVVEGVLLALVAQSPFKSENSKFHLF